MEPVRIFHISENGEIEIFKPRPSPSGFDKITGDVVFGISDKLLHNYLFPRDCPRVTYYAKRGSTQFDKDKFLQPPAEFVVAIETKWFPILQRTTLYCYEFDSTSFSILDECAGYYISYKQVKPISIRRIDNLLDELFRRDNIELRILPTLWNLVDEVIASTLNFSLIRMRNAQPRESGLLPKA